MTMNELEHQAELLRLVAIEVAEEPDTIMRRPEVVDLLFNLADTDEASDVFDRVIPGVVEQPSEYVRALAQVLAAFRDAPMDDAPEVVEAVALLAWVFQEAAAGRQAVEPPALAFA